MRKRLFLCEGLLSVGTVVRPNFDESPFGCDLGFDFADASPAPGTTVKREPGAEMNGNENSWFGSSINWGLVTAAIPGWNVLVDISRKFVNSGDAEEAQCKGHDEKLIINNNNYENDQSCNDGDAPSLQVDPPEAFIDPPVAIPHKAAGDENPVNLSFVDSPFCSSSSKKSLGGKIKGVFKSCLSRVANVKCCFN